MDLFASTKKTLGEKLHFSCSTEFKSSKTCNSMSKSLKVKLFKSRFQMETKFSRKQDELEITQRESPNSIIIQKSKIGKILFTLCAVQEEFIEATKT